MQTQHSSVPQPQSVSHSPSTCTEEEWGGQSGAQLGASLALRSLVVVAPLGQLSLFHCRRLPPRAHTRCLCRPPFLRGSSAAPRTVTRCLEVAENMPRNTENRHLRGISLSSTHWGCHNGSQTHSNACAKDESDFPLFFRKPLHATFRSFRATHFARDSPSVCGVPFLAPITNLAHGYRP